MASKITALTEDTSPTGDDVMEMVQDPAGTPLSRKVKIQNLLKRLFLGDATMLTVTTIADGEFLKRSGTNLTSGVPSGTGIGGSTGATDNAVLRADGTGGATAQNSTVTIDDTGAITVPEMTPPATPAAGKVALYAKADGLLYSKDDAGTETVVTGGGGGGGSPGGADGDIQYRIDSSTFGGSPLKREDANTIAQRNGTTVQTFRVHNTYTSSTNYEALALYWSGNVGFVETEKGSGGGSQRTLALGGLQIQLRTTAGGSSLSVTWDINSNANDGALLPGGDGLYDIGNNNKRVRDIFSLASPTFVSSDFTKSANTTLSNVTGLTRAIQSGKKYRFEATLYFTADATGGHKYAINASGGAPSSIIYQIVSIDNGTPFNNLISSNQTTNAGSAGQAGATAGFTKIVGFLQAGANGNLTVQFAQNAASGSSSILAGSTFKVEIIES